MVAEQQQQKEVQGPAALVRLVFEWELEQRWGQQVAVRGQVQQWLGKEVEEVWAFPLGSNELKR